MDEAAWWEPYASGPGFAEGLAGVRGGNRDRRVGPARPPHVRASLLGRVGAGSRGCFLGLRAGALGECAYGWRDGRLPRTE